MNKKLFYAVTSTLAATAMAFAAAGIAGCTPDKPGLSDKPLNATTVVADFTEGVAADEMYASDGYSNGDSFNTEWDPSCVSYEDGYAKLGIAPITEGTGDQGVEYYSGELRTKGYYGYGDYQVSMKPEKKDGTASTFFVCTGDYDYQPGATADEPNPWDEIDIEFLGYDTTIVQFNYIVNGVGINKNEHIYELGFDASEEFHTYGFRWAEDYITWFVDNKPVYRVDVASDNPMPSTEGRIIMNYWCGAEKAEGWMGKYENPGDDGTEYQWVKTSALRAYDESEAGPVAETPDVEGVTFTDADMSAVSASSGNPEYTVTPVAEGYEIIYEDLVGNWQNVSFGGIASIAQVNNLFKAEVKNAGSETVSFRVDIMSTNKVNENTNATNLLAMQDGVAVETNREWGGSLFTVEPGETVEIVIEYNNGYPLNDIQFMFDSHLQDGPATHSGDIVVSGLAFGANADVSTEIQPSEPQPFEGAIDLEGVQFEKVNTENVTVGGNTEIYTVTRGQDSFDIAYGQFTANYQNVSFAGMNGQDNNIFKAKVTNNGTETVNFRVDIMSSMNVNANTKATNLKATQDGVLVETNLDWGGSFFTVEAGASVEIVVQYDNSYPHASVLIMLDSATGGNAVSGGNVTVSEMAFGANGDAATDVGQPETASFIALSAHNALPAAKWAAKAM